MKYLIRELRDKTGLSQNEFAKTYHIPLSTLRKWEQGVASPPAYVVELLARAIPGTYKNMEEITYREEKFYYDPAAHIIADSLGNEIRIQSDLTSVNRSNLALYLHDMFRDFYECREQFERDCKYDIRDDIIWTERGE